LQTGKIWYNGRKESFEQNWRLREKLAVARLASTLTIAMATFSTNGDLAGEKEGVE
jgi:hypothetical protein